MTSKHFSILCGGFVLSFLVAMGVGQALRIALQSAARANDYFQPEVAGTVSLMTLCYVLVHRYAGKGRGRQG